MPLKLAAFPGLTVAALAGIGGYAVLRDLGAVLPWGDDGLGGLPAWALSAAAGVALIWLLARR